MPRSPARAAFAAVVACGVVACGLSGLAAPAPADEPVRPFLEGLRERGLSDFALLELDRLAADPATPADVKTVLPYERAVTLLDQARAGSGARAKLDEAAALLERFAEAAPDHPLAGGAQFLRAEILQRSAADLLGAGDPAALPEDVKAKARRLLEDAGRVYASARRALEKTLREIGPYVDQKDDAARADRAAAEARLIRARVEAARATFLRAQTYPAGDPARERLLVEADGPLEEVRKDYRTKIGALPGRIVQGQILQARVPEDPAGLSGDARADAKEQLAKAGALYDEVADQAPPQDAPRDVREAVNNLRGTAQRLKFAALNHPLRADHPAVIAQATDWLAENRTAGEADTAAGILLERGRAYENSDPAELRKALNDYQTAARRSDAVRGPATLAADRVRGRLGLDRAEPKSFGDAFDAAQALVRQISEKQRALADAATDAEKSEARETLDAHLEETARLLAAATDLADARTDPGDLGRTRYLLAYVDVQLGRYYEAAVLAEDVARNFRPAPLDPEKPDLNRDQRGIPLEAASTAALAWTKAYQDRPAGTDGSFELAQLGAAADFIAERFPDSDRASAARMTLGRVLLREGELADAAAVFAAVPESDAAFPDARLLAGDALWRRYVELSNSPTPPPDADLDDLKARAKNALRAGIAAVDAKLPADAEAPPNLTVGKVTLAQIANRDGEFAAARDVLTNPPRPVVGETGAVAAAGDRPARGVTSAAFAGLAFQQLLRAQIGLRAIGPAMQTMRDLEGLGAGGNTAVFVSLGRQIEEELAALEPGPQREETLSGFEQFLGEIGNLQGQTYGSRLWVAETYAGLAGSQPAGSDRAKGYSSEAAESLRAALASLDEPGFLPEGTAKAAAESGLKLRLAETLGGAGRYPDAYEAVTDVLAGSPNALNAQTAAAQLLSDWGAAEGDAATLVKALRGDGAVWGWGTLARRLAAQLAGPSGDRYQADYNAARLKIPEVRAALAETKSGEEKNTEFAKAERELIAWITTTDPADIAPETRRAAEELYEDLQRGRGVADPRPLPSDAAAPALADAGGGAAPAAADAETPAAAAADDEPSGPGVGLLIGLLALAGLATAGAIWAFKPKKKKRARRRSGGKSAPSSEAKAKDRAKGGREAVRVALPDVAPVPAAAPAAASAAPTGTGFPDFSNLPAKGVGGRSAASGSRRAKAAPTAASAAAPAGKVRRSSSSSRPSSSSSSSSSSKGGAKPAVRRSSASASASPRSPDPSAPRKKRPRPEPPAE